MPRAMSGTVAAAVLKVGDLVVCEADDVIPGDGDIIEGVASVDESAITGESAPVVRESGGDRSSVTGGTRVLSDRIVIRITTEPGQSFVDRMIALVEGSVRQKTPNEIALNILLASLTIVFLLVTMALQPMAAFAGSPQSIVILVALLVCLIPTTIGALVSAIGVAGMDRLVQHNVLAMSGRAVEAAGDVSTLLLDKTGTITYGNRQASRLIPAPGVDADELAACTLRGQPGRRDPGGKVDRRVVPQRVSRRRALVRCGRPGRRGHRVLRPHQDERRRPAVRRTAAGRSARAPSPRSRNGSPTTAATVPAESLAAADEISADGGTPLLVADSDRVLGVVHLKDVVKPGIAERFAELRAMGIRTVMITGDTALTAQSIAKEAGVDDFLAEATPEDKLAYIRQQQQGGRIIAMTGDGTNDAPALAQADVGVAMNSGTAAAKEAGNMVDLDSSPTKLIDIVEIGKQLLITRGALTTFSIANDVAKYFAILPAMFMGAYPGSGRTEHHAAVLADLGHPVRGGLQCADHHRADPAGHPRRPVPPVVGGAAVEPQPADLRPRRPGRPVHRDQDHRPRPVPHSRNRLNTMTTNTSTCAPAAARSPRRPSGAALVVHQSAGNCWSRCGYLLR